MTWTHRPTIRTNYVRSEEHSQAGGQRRAWGASNASHGADKTHMMILVPWRLRLRLQAQDR